MARYSIYDGGNLRLYPWENDRNSGIDPTYAVRYSAHLTNFHKVLRYHVDFNNSIFAKWVNDSMPTGMMEVGDELVTHLFGPGTYIDRFAVQVKGIPPIVGEAGNPPPVPPEFGITVEDEDGTVLHDYGTITMDALGYTSFPSVDVFLPNNAFLVSKLIAGDASYSCFGLMTALVQLLDGHACECAVEPCGADFPDPDCVPSGLTDGDSTGLGLASDAVVDEPIEG